jgi:hypothetical protein
MELIFLVIFGAYINYKIIIFSNLYLIIILPSIDRSYNLKYFVNIYFDIF